MLASAQHAWTQGRAPLEELDLIATMAQGLLAEAGGASPVAAGCALAALVDQAGTVVQWPNRPAWQGLPFRCLLEERLAVPLVVEDDANAAAVAEWQFGAAQGYAHALVMMVGPGVGAGMILNGALVRGRSGWAGELGHIVMDRDGPPCPCGHNGCLQVLASGRALERAAHARGLAGSAAVAALASQGDPWARAVIEDCARWVGIAAANVANLLDLEAVIIGGGLSHLDEVFWGALGATFQSYLLNAQHREVILLPASLPDTAGLLGAAYLAQQRAVGGRG